MSNNKNYMGIQCPDSLREKLDAYVKELNEQEMLGASRSAVIRKAIVEYMENHPNKTKEVTNEK